MNFVNKQIEKKLGIDLNHDGVVGSGHSHGHQPQHHASSGIGDKIIDKLEKITGKDLNGDGHIGGSNQHGHPHHH